MRKVAALVGTLALLAGGYAASAIGNPSAAPPPPHTSSDDSTTGTTSTDSTSSSTTATDSTTTDTTTTTPPPDSTTTDTTSTTTTTDSTTTDTAATSTTTATTAPAPPPPAPSTSAATTTTRVQPDRTPPGEVSLLKIFPGDRAIQLTWKPPSDSDFDHVTITRSLADDTQASVVYTGSAASFTDRDVQNRIRYRYVVVAVDKAGNASAGVVAVAAAKQTMLRAPRDGARLRRPPKLTWRRAPSATYYNLQLFRGTTKILSAWPKKTSLQLQKTWKYGGKRVRLSRARYTWYVWPGYGRRADVNYGDLLGFSSFVILR